MSDSKPKRPVRESARSEVIPVPVPVAKTAPVEIAATVVVPPIVVEPAPVMHVPVAAAVAPAPVALPAAIARPAAPLDDAWAIFAAAQSAFARSVEAFTAEVAEAAKGNMARTSQAAIALIGAKTFAEALEINTGLVRQGVDTALESSAKLSEIGVKAMTDASRPWLSQFGPGLTAFGLR